MRLKIILKVPTMMPTMNALMPKKLIMPNVLPKTIPNPRQMKPTLIETSATWLCAPACHLTCKCLTLKMLRKWILTSGVEVAISHTGNTF